MDGGVDMSSFSLARGPWVPCVSSSDELDVCTAIKDKGNGNCLVVNEIDEDYESLLLALPKMYEMLEFISENPSETNVVAIRRLLAKARGES